MRSRRAAAAILLAFAATLALGLAAQGSAARAVPATSSKASPSLYWGAQIGDHLTGEQAPWDMTAVQKFERLVKKNVSLVSFQAPFADCEGKSCTFYSFPTTPMEDLRSHGAIPFFSWSSSSDEDGTTHDPMFRLKKVASGRYDDYIRSFAQSAADWGHPFFLRFNWEMNGDWFPWGDEVNGNKRRDFVAVWRHVHGIFESVGADNATWVWCPNVGEEVGLRGLYPGDRYVDWTCLDGYNWGTRYHWSSWQSFDEIFRDSYKRVLRIAPSKPMVIGEVASTTFGGSKAAWIRDLLRVVPARYPKIRALIWFDVHDRGTKWPIDRPRKVTKAFAAGIANPVYKSNVFGEIASNPIEPPAP